MYEKKIEIIDSYINKCEEILKNQDDEKASVLLEEFIGVYRNEIQHIGQGLNAFASGEQGDETYLDDVSIVKQKLENYRADWLSKAEDKEYELKIAEANSTSITNSNNLNNNVSITLSQVYDAVDNSKSLSDEDLQKLKKLLGQINIAQANKDKKTVKAKVAAVLHFIADKGVDVLIAAGPYLVQALK